VRFALLSQLKPAISLNNIIQLEAKFVVCETETEFLYILL